MIALKRKRNSPYESVLVYRWKQSRIMYM